MKQKIIYRALMIFVCTVLAGCTSNTMRQFLSKQGDKYIQTYINNSANSLMHRNFILLKAIGYAADKGTYENYSPDYGGSIAGTWSCINDTLTLTPCFFIEPGEQGLDVSEISKEYIDTNTVIQKCLITDKGLVDITDYTECWQKLREKTGFNADYHYAPDTDRPDYILLKYTKE